MNTQSKTALRERRRKRIRAKVFGTAEKPRLSIFKSNRYISAQLINDETGSTLAALTTKDIKGKNMRAKAETLGETLGKVALTKEIKMAVFDKGGYLYTGSVAAVADGARKAGLKL